MVQPCNCATGQRRSGTILLLHFSTSARFRPYRVCQCCRCVRFWSTPPSPALPLTVHSPLGSSNNATALLARNERLVALCETATMVRTLLHTSTIRALQTTISLFCGTFFLFFSQKKRTVLTAGACLALAPLFCIPKTKIEKCFGNLADGYTVHESPPARLHLANSFRVGKNVLIIGVEEVGAVVAPRR